MIQTFFVEDTNRVKLCDKNRKEILICHRDEWHQRSSNSSVKGIDVGWVIPLYIHVGPEGQSDDILHEWDDLAPGATRLDGEFMYAKCPDGHTWCVDGRASNCTKPEDKEHKCWVR